MRYNFTDSVRRALSRARQEAIRLRHGVVSTEHMLLGLLADRDICSALESFGIDPADVRNGVEFRSPVGKDSFKKGELPYTVPAKKALEYAMRTARERGDPYVGNEHMLSAILEEESGIGGEVLRTLGLRQNDVDSISFGPGGKIPAEPIVRIDEASDLSIYEQIVAQITESVATGRLRSGERLPTVRQMADTLDIAPGTVARAYSELESQKVVITEGARGTRVAERSRPSAGDEERSETLTGLLRPVAVAAFHLGASASDLRKALERAMVGIFKDRAA